MSTDVRPNLWKTVRASRCLKRRHPSTLTHPTVDACAVRTNSARRRQTDFGQTHIDALELSASLAKQIAASSRVLRRQNFIAQRLRGRIGESLRRCGRVDRVAERPLSAAPARAAAAAAATARTQERQPRTAIGRPALCCVRQLPNVSTEIPSGGDTVGAFGGRFC
jgi:hypothetical protein